MPGRAHRHLKTPGISSLCCCRKWPVSCKWLLFLPHHAVCWKATRFNAGLQRGCLPVPHRGLCAVTLRVLTLEGGGKGWGRVGLGVQGGANSELNEPPGSLGVVRQPPTFSTCVLPPSLGLPLPCRSLALSLFLALSLTKLDPRPTGPDPRTGSSQLAYQELPQRSPDTVIEGEQRKQGPQKTELWPFWEAFCFLCGHMLCVFM